MKKLNLIFLFGLTLSCKGQSQSQRFTNYTTQVVGTWVSEEDLTNKIKFSSNGKFEVYTNNSIVNTSTYSLETSCGSNSNNGYDIFLKIKIDASNSSCDIINNISTDSSGKTILSLTTEQGQLDLYIKQ